MRTLLVKVRDEARLPFKAVEQLASQHDVSQVISEPTRFVCADTGKPLGMYCGMENSTDLESAVRTIRYNKDWRSAGLTTNARTFGYLPRVALRRDFCTRSSLEGESPEANAILDAWTHRVSDVFKANFPEQHAKQLALIEANILPEWRYPGTIFTTGVVNWNSRLAYHRDKGNFKESWNIMATLKRGCTGGHLVIPAFDIALECADRTLASFYAQNHLHGVSEFKLAPGPKSWRCTIVWYAMKGLANALPLEEEVARIRRVKVGREESRLLDVASQEKRIGRKTK